MRFTLTALAVAAALVTGSFTARVSGSTGPIPLNCDRACLEGLIDQYLAAVVAHDPSKLPLSKDVKYSENYQMLEVGDGFWKTASGVGNYKHVFADPEAGQVAMMGTMREANTTLLMSVRLRIELGRITEIESVYFKPGGGGPNNIEGMDKSGKPEDIWFRVYSAGAAIVTTADDRRRRWLLHRSPEERWQGHRGQRHLSLHQRLPSHRERIADDQRTRVRRTRSRARSICSPWTACPNSRWGSTTSCRTSTGAATRSSTLERGVVWAHCVFDQGTVNQGVLSDGTRHSYPGFNRPSSILVTEAFLIEDGKIRRVEMIGPSATYHMNSPWPGGLSGN